MDTDEWLRRGSSFERVAATYADHRPGYPDEAVRWLVGGDGRPVRVLELGAGTGKLTRTLCELGHEVIATEPSSAMLASLVRVAPRGHAVLARAEDIPFSASTVDVVIAAQAFHWFDQSRTLPDVARVLRPGGVLSLVWNDGDTKVPWVRKVFSLMRDPSAEGLDPLRESDIFSTFEQRVFRHWQVMHRDSLIGFIASSSRAATLTPEERTDLLAEAGSIYDSYGRGSAGMRLPWKTYCYRARVTGTAATPPSAPDDGLLIDFR